MASQEPNLTKLSLEELEDLYERQKNILQNKKRIAHLPDKGKQLEEKLKKVENELNLRRNINELEKVKISSLNYQETNVLTDKYVQHMCHLEKSTQKERYKPFSTLVANPKNKIEKPTQLIPLVESMVLLTEQANKLPIEKVKKVIEGTEMKDEINSEDFE